MKTFLFFLLFIYFRSSNTHPVLKYWDYEGEFRYNSKIPLVAGNKPSSSGCNKLCEKYPYSGYEKKLQQCYCFHDITAFELCEKGTANCEYVFYSNKLNFANEFSLFSSVIFDGQKALLYANTTLELSNANVNITINGTQTDSYNVWCENEQCDVKIDWRPFHKGVNLLCVYDAISKQCFDVLMTGKRPFTYNITGTYREFDKQFYIAAGTCLSIHFNPILPMKLAVTSEPLILNETLHLNTSVCSLLNIFFNTSGSYDLSFHGNVGEYHYAEIKKVFVQERIKDLCIVNKEVYIGEMNELQVSYNGPKDNVLFEWTLNLKDNLSTNVPYCNYTVLKSDHFGFRVQVTASNLVSRVAAVRYLSVTEDLSKIRLQAPPDPIIVGDNIHVFVQIGNHNLSAFGYNYQWRIETDQNTTMIGSNEMVTELKPTETGTYNISVEVTGGTFGKFTTSIIRHALRRIAPFKLMYYYEKCNKIELDGNVDEEDYEASFFNASYNLAFHWSFGDGTSRGFNKAVSNKTYNITCRRNITYKVELYATNIISNFTAYTWVKIKEEICNIQIQMPWKYHVKREYLFSQEIVFQPSVYVNCPTFTVIKHLWEFTNLESNTTSRDYKESVTWKPRSFEVGEWTYNYTVTAQDQNVSRTWDGAFRVDPSPLQARINNRQKSYHVYNIKKSRKIILNGSMSQDIDKPKNQSNLRFRWYCLVDDPFAVSYDTVKSCLKPNHKIDLTKPVLEINYKDDIPLNHYEEYRKVLFVLEVSAKHKDTANATMLIEFSIDTPVKKFSKSFELDCISCINGDYQPTVSRTVFQVQPQFQDDINTQNYSFKWSFENDGEWNIFNKFQRQCTNTYSKKNWHLNPNKPVKQLRRFKRDLFSKDKTERRFNLETTKESVNKTCGNITTIFEIPMLSSCLPILTNTSSTNEKCAKFVHDVSNFVLSNTTRVPTKTSSSSSWTLPWSRTRSVPTTIYGNSRPQPTNKWLKGRIKTYKVLEKYLKNDRKYSGVKLTVRELVFGYYPNTRERNELVCSNQHISIKKGSFFTGVLIPTKEYRVTLEIREIGDPNKTVVGYSHYFFTAAAKPNRGQCHVTTFSLERIETERFLIRCQGWRTKYPLTIIFQAWNPITKNYDLVLITKKSVFSFMLPLYKLQTKEAIFVRVTLVTPTGDFTKVCSLKVEVKRDYQINLDYISKQLTSIVNVRRLMKSYYNTFQKLNIFYRYITRFDAMTKSQVEKRFNIRNRLCELVKEFHNASNEENDFLPIAFINIFGLVMSKPLELSDVCVNWIVKTTHETLIENRRQIQRHNSSFLIDHNPFINDTLKIIERATDFYDGIHGTSKNVYKIVLLFREFTKLLSESFYSGEVYIDYESPFLTAHAMKFYPNKQVLSLGNTYVTINVPYNVKNVKDDQCVDFHFALLGKQEQKRSYEKYRKFEIRFSNCSRTNSSSQVAATIKVPVTYHYYNYILNWKEINYHLFNVSSKSDKILVFVRMNTMSLNSVHFKVKLCLRRRINGRFFLYHKDNKNLTYPNDCHRGICALHIDQEYKEETQFNLSVIIESESSKVTDYPWFNYSVAINTPHCDSIDINGNDLNHTTDACDVDEFNQHTDKHIACLCTSSSFIMVYPYDVGHRTTIELHENESIGTFLPVYVLIAALGVFLLLVRIYWSQENSEPESLFELPENHPCDSYHWNIGSETSLDGNMLWCAYALLFETGYSYNAGTTSQVCAILHGTKGHSEKVELTHTDVNLFERSSKDTVIVSCPKDLGDLTRLVVWHTNSGLNPDWYIKQIVVKDLSTRKISFFPFHNWLSLSKGIHNISVQLIATDQSCHSNYQVEFPIAQKHPQGKGMLQDADVKVQYILEKFLDFHLWLSILFGPLKTRFSTFERLCCVLETFVFYFVASFVFFQRYINDNDNLLDILHMPSLKVFRYGLMVILLHLPVKLLLSCLFRESQLISMPKSQFSKRKKRLKRNKVDVYNYTDNTKYESKPYTLTAEGIPSYYEMQHLDQWSVESQSFKLAPEPPQISEVCTIDLPKYYRWFGLIVTFLIIVCGAVLVVYKSLSLPDKFTIPWLQLLFIATTFDFFFTSTIEALLTSIFLLKVSWGKRAYDSIFNRLEKLRNYFPKEYFSLVEDPFYRKTLHTRQRARFIRYAEPMTSEEIRKKKVKARGKALFKKTIMKKELHKTLTSKISRITIVISLLLISLVLIHDEDVTTVYHERNFVKNAIESTFQVLLTTSNKSAVHDIKTFWIWSNASIPLLLNYGNWHEKKGKRSPGISRKIVGRAFIQRTMQSGLKQDEVFLRGNVKQTLQYLKDEEWFNKFVRIITYHFATIHIFEESSIMYSYVCIDFTRHPTGNLIPRVKVDSIKLDERTELMQQPLLFIALVALFVLLSFMLVRSYNKFLHSGVQNIFTISTFCNLLLILCGFSVLLLYMMERITVFYLKDLLSTVRLDYHGINPKFVDLRTMICLKQKKGTSQDVKNQYEMTLTGLFFFMVCVKSLSLFKLHPVTRNQLKILKTALHKLKYYVFIFILSLTLAYSNYMFFLHHNTSVQFSSYANTFNYILLHIPRLFTHINVMKDLVWNGYTMFGVIVAFILFFFVKMSVVFFIGTTKSCKRKREKKTVSLKWMIKYGRKMILDFISRKRKFNKKEKTNKKYYRVPKKHVFDEIDNQLDEVLYRLNSLADFHGYDLSDTDESYTDNSPSYISEELTSNTSSSLDHCSQKPNTDGLSFTFNTTCTAKGCTGCLKRTSLTSRTNILLVKENAQGVSNVDNRVRQLSLTSGSDRSTGSHDIPKLQSSIGSFKRFSLPKIIESNIVINQSSHELDVNRSPDLKRYEHPITAIAEESRIKQTKYMKNADVMVHCPSQEVRNFDDKVRRSSERLTFSSKQTPLKTSTLSNKQQVRRFSLPSYKTSDVDEKPNEMMLYYPSHQTRDEKPHQRIVHNPSQLIDNKMSRSSVSSHQKTSTLSTNQQNDDEKPMSPPDKQTDFKRFILPNIDSPITGGIVNKAFTDEQIKQDREEWKRFILKENAVSDSSVSSDEELSKDSGVDSSRTSHQNSPITHSIYHNNRISFDHELISYQANGESKESYRKPFDLSSVRKAIQKSLE